MVHIADIAAGVMLVSGVVSLSLLGFAVNAYRRNRDPAMGFVAGAFTVFTAKSFLVGYSLVSGMIEHTTLELVDAVGDMGTVLLLLAPIFWPQRLA